MPAVGEEVELGKKKGKVVGLNVLEKKVRN